MIPVRFMKLIFALPVILLPARFTIAQNAPARVMKIHHRAYVIDTHTDTPMELINGQFDPSRHHEAPASRVDFPRLREGDVDAIFFALYTGQRERTPENYEHAYQLVNQMLDSTLVAVRRNPQTVRIATSTKAIINASKHNKTAICLGMENGFPLARDLSRVKEFYQKGVRYITLCHSSNNDICDSSTDPDGPEHNGLSNFGREVTAEMNRVGMIIDVSHISDKSFFDVLEVSKAPVIASHSSVRSFCNHPRNLSDDMIRALAEHGGVIQICILGSYIVPEDTTSEHHIKHEELRLPTIAQAVDHIDHVVKLVGIDHVGIGSDFDGGGGLADCEDVADFPKITAELIKRGYTKKDIAKIWGGNFLRVFRSVEKFVN